MINLRALAAKQRLTIATRVLALATWALLVMMVGTLIALVRFHGALESSRKTEVQHEVEIALTLVGHYVAAHERNELTREAAEQRVIAELKSLKFGKDSYFFAYRLDGTALADGHRPDFEGTNQIGLKDANGKALIAEMADLTRGGKSGHVEHLWSATGDATASKKISFVAPVPAFGWFVGSGVHVDDIWQATIGLAAEITLYASPLLLAYIALATYVFRSISLPLRAMTSSMISLANGNFEIRLSALGRRDELGEMAAAVELFKVRAVERARLDAEQQAAEMQRHAERRQKEMLALADSFEATVGNVVGKLAAASAELSRNSEQLSNSATVTKDQSRAVTEASERASSNLQSVASATTELSCSIREIGSDIRKSSDMATRATESARTTSDQVMELARSTSEIGGIVALINTIAEQTNLLALNATIEAARAGDAGKGFAVVAQEVKSLATQTASATKEIASQIDLVQSATQKAATQVQSIAEAITEVNSISGSIAEAMSEQSAATEEIAANVTRVKNGTESVVSNIAEVHGSAEGSSAAAAQVLGAARELSRQAEMLRSEVGGFVNRVRAA